MESNTKTKLSLTQIKLIMQKGFGDNVQFTLDGELEDGWFNTIYSILLGDQRKVLLKISPPPNIKLLRYEKDVMYAEVEILRFLKENKIVPVPSVYLHDYSKTIIPNDYFVMEKLPGIAYSKIKKSLTQQESDQIEIELGRYNRRINDIKGTEFGYYYQPKKKRARWADAFFIMIHDILQDGLECKVKLPMAYDKIEDMISSRIQILDEIVEPSLIHWDLHGGNVIVEDGKISGLIDCDRAIWGDPLVEFYFGDFTGHDNFCKGYGSNPLDTESGKQRRVIYNVYLYLIMVVESYYRNYTKEHLAWAYDLLTKELALLESL